MRDECGNIKRELGSIKIGLGCCVTMAALEIIDDTQFHISQICTENTYNV